MANPVKLRLELVDVYDKPLQEVVDIFLRHQELSDIQRAKVSAAKTIEIEGLHGAPKGRYRIDIDPPSYQYLANFINLKASGITSHKFVFAIDPNKVTKVDFLKYSALSPDCRAMLERTNSLLSFVGQTGQTLYEALDDVRRAGLLNIVTKAAATLFPNGRSVLSYINELKELRGDRFFANVSKDLREETKHSTNSNLFRSVSGSLHHPPTGFSDAGSFKTTDRYGNLQLTFFMKGEDCVVDVDIDDAAGFEHVFQVLGNKLSGKPTHPYNIHEILVGVQKLDPGYKFSITT